MRSLHVYVIFYTHLCCAGAFDVHAKLGFDVKTSDNRLVKLKFSNSNAICVSLLHMGCCGYADELIKSSLAFALFTLSIKQESTYTGTHIAPILRQATFRNGSKTAAPSSQMSSQTPLKWHID